MVKLALEAEIFYIIVIFSVVIFPGERGSYPLTFTLATDFIRIYANCAICNTSKNTVTHGK